MLSRAISYVAALLIAGCIATTAGPANAAPEEWRTFDLDLEYRVSVHRTLGFVSGIAQTPDGYLWFATSFGLARYDGVRFAFFDSSNTPEIKDDHIQHLISDGSDGLWIATLRGGLLHFLDGKFENTDVPGVPADAQLCCVGRDSKGGLWLGTARHGLHHFSNGSWSRATEVGENIDRLVVGYKNVLLFSASNNWWVVKDGILSLADDVHRGKSAGENTPFLLSQVLPPESPPIDSPIFDGIRDRFLQASSVTEDGALWLGSSGLTLINGGNIRKFRPINGVASENVLSIFQDRERNVWAGHYGTGLTQMTRVPFFNFSMRQGFGGGTAFSLAEASDGTIWIGHSNGLTEVRGNKFRNWLVTDTFPGWSVRSIALGQNDSLWMTMMDRGIGHFDNGQLKTYKSPRFMENPELSALMFTKNHQLWSASVLGGLVTLNDDKLEEVAVPELGPIGCAGPSTSETPCPQSINVLVQAKNGAMWMGTSGRGLWLRSAGGSSQQIPNDKLNNSFVFDILEENESTIWVGTDHGLFLLRNGVAHNFTRAQGLISDGVFCVVDDQNGSMWLCSERGVAKIKKSEFEALIRGDLQRVDPVNYRAQDGLPSDEFIRRFEKSGMRAKDGRLWFAAVAGVAIFAPPERIPVPPPPAARLERVVLKRKEFTPPWSSEPVIVAPGQGDLEFHYTAPAFTAPHRLRFRYRLKGFDADWVRAADRRAAYYTNIPPGNYVFEVVAESPGTMPSQVVGSFSFELRPEFYQTIWFYFALVLLALLAAVAVQRLRIRAVRAKFQAVLEERNRIARDLHDTLAQVFSAIGFQIDSVIGLVSHGQALPKDRLKRVRQMVGHARLAARNVIWNLRQSEGEDSSVASLVSKLEAIPPLYDSAQIAVTATTTVRALPANIENELFHIAQEAVSNAVEHGKAGLISIELELNEDQIELLIHDNGVGFEPRTPEQADEPRFGLRGMRERATRIAAEMLIHTEPDVGTEVSVKVKLAAPPNKPA